MTAADDGTVQRFTGLGDHVDMVDSEIASMLRGRAVRTPRFRVWAVCLIVPTVALSCALVVWAAWFGAADEARPAQVGWAVTLPVVAGAVLWLIGRSGTAVHDVGLVHTSGLRTERLAWADIRRFTYTHGGGPGLGVITNKSRRLRVPSALHTMDPDRAYASAAFLNRHFGLLPEPPQFVCPAPGQCPWRYPSNRRDGAALEVLRTVEFRQTLRGYHIDDVDEYLERVATEVDALAATLRRLGIEAMPLVRRRDAIMPPVATTESVPAVAVPTDVTPTNGIDPIDKPIRTAAPEQRDPLQIAPRREDAAGVAECSASDLPGPRLFTRRS